LSVERGLPRNPEPHVRNRRRNGDGGVVDERSSHLMSEGIDLLGPNARGIDRSKRGRERHVPRSAERAVELDHDRTVLLGLRADRSKRHGSGRPYEIGHASLLELCSALSQSGERLLPTFHAKGKNNSC
jgi:hypothetical protein